ncbi:hypothetical protein [Pyrobaculum islandicum]|uniref:hypothetical protein n=1 Tax=Pyrobaculum islandicum TaxID=2277 RepID=UPI000B0BF827|nr:hypothetical protein [Pyrobaculum islandicum]
MEAEGSIEEGGLKKGVGKTSRKDAEGKEKKDNVHVVMRTVAVPSPRLSWRTS